MADLGGPRRDTGAQPAPFGELLAGHRVAASLTQEMLAARSGLSVDAISMLERGHRRTPRANTVALLADALRLSADERTAFAAAAQGQDQPDMSSSAPRRPPTALIGREDEVARACDLLTGMGPPVLTLTGPPGVGKTRIALEVAAILRGSFADGVCWVELAPLRSAELLAAAIRRALGPGETRSMSPLAAVIAHCRQRRLLLVLDTFEHCRSATPVVIDLIESCPGVKVLVTSRAPLRIRAEHELPVPPLRLPDAGDLSAPSVLARVPAVALFAVRAAAVTHGFRVAPANATAVAAICRSLDGLPLALELAAPWIKVLSPEALRERLDHRLGLLVGGSRDLPERQRTMLATLEWSYELLEPGQRAVFRRMAGFGGSASLDAIESLCAAAGGVEGGVLSGLAGLIDQSLVVRRDGPRGETRLSMLQVVREYARDLLDEAGETDATMRACAEHLIALAERASSARGGPGLTPWLERLESEHDNVRAVLQWALEGGEAALGLRLAAGVAQYWYLRGHRQEGLSWMERLLDRSGTAAPPALRARALNAAGRKAWGLGSLDLSLERHGEALSLCESLGDPSGAANALNGMGVVAGIRGDYALAASRFERAHHLYREAGHAEGVTQALGNLATALNQSGDLARGRALHEEQLGVLRRIGDAQGTSMRLAALGEVARLQGDLVQAEAWLREAVDLARDVDAPHALAAGLMNLADLRRTTGDQAAARAGYVESLELFDRIGDLVAIASCVVGLALVARGEGRPQLAAALYGGAAAMRDAVGSSPQPNAFVEHERALDAIREELGPVAFAASYAAGGRLSHEEVLAAALGRGE